MRIVVPTDFSELAKIAVHYAVEFARQSKSELVLLYILPNLGPTMGTLSTAELKKDILEEAEQKLHDLMQDIKADDLSIKPQVAYGPSVEEVLEDFTKTHAIDLIIMGSKGATGLTKVLLGSSTVAVINHCSVPVIAVPDCATIGKIEYLVYASDLKNLQQEVMMILPYAKLLDTTIKIIHVPQLNDPEMVQTESLLKDLIDETGYAKIQLEIIKGEDVVQSIETYTEIQQAELLVMFTQKSNFLEQLFSKSITREIAWHCKTPLLVINNR